MSYELNLKARNLNPKSINRFNDNQLINYDVIKLIEIESIL